MCHALYRNDKPSMNHADVFHHPRCLKSTDYLSDVLPHDLDHVGHGEVHDVVSPGELKDDVRAQQVVALEEAGGETLVVLALQEPRNEVLRNVDLARFPSIHHCILSVKKNNMGVISEILRCFYFKKNC